MKTQYKIHISEISLHYVSQKWVVLAWLMLLTACVSTPIDPPSSATISVDLRCINAQRYAGLQIGDGHCVSLITHCTGSPPTAQWRPGEKVLSFNPSSNTIPSGSIIATFKNGRYPSRRGYHAAIYISHDNNGIWVWDQWLGKPVHRRLIRTVNTGANASNTAEQYRLVKLAK